MGLKRPARWPLDAWRTAASDISPMIRQRWDVVAECRACGQITRVDLLLIHARLGPRFSLWGRHPRCRRAFCTGRVVFKAKPPELERRISLVGD